MNIWKVHTVDDTGTVANRRVAWDKLSRDVLCRCTYITKAGLASIMVGADYNRNRNRL